MKADSSEAATPLSPKSSEEKAAALLDDIPVEVVTFFATPEDGIIVQVRACDVTLV